MTKIPTPGTTDFHREAPPPSHLPYRVHSIGRMHDQPYHATRGTYFRDAMFTLFLSGKGRYLQGRRETSVGKGMVGLVLPGRDVGLLLADPDDPYDHYYCRFAGAEAMRTARRISAERGGEPFSRWENRRNAVELLEKMCRLGCRVEDLEIDRTRRIDAMLAELLSLLDFPWRGTGSELSTQNLQRYLHNHIAEPADLQAVADHFRLSRCYVSRVAKELLGETLMDAWGRVKINWAQTLLRETPLPIAQIARRVGYRDAFYFSKVFRRFTRQTPRNWRKGKSPR
ncbi:MAG: helix-turn-helix domain-containing protein [Phycisphaerae bacterium]|nr:helix-turn-helix domain-containing protein [Phycisphaerae bacterium]